MTRTQLIGTHLILLILLLGACSSNDDSNPPEMITPISDVTPMVVTVPDNSDGMAEMLNWAKCDDAPAVFECSTLSVPMDYRVPEGKELDIALIRLPASGENRLGTLTIMIGGPAPYVEFTQVLVQFGVIPDSVLASYDIVGFDQRGLGASTSVDCSEFGLEVAHPYPQNADHIAQMHADYSQMATDCFEKEGEILSHLGSMNVVRDMNSMRIALGDEQLNMIGNSFGTRFAVLYLQQFPESSGRVVLDASLPADPSLPGLFANSIAGREAGLLAALSECKSTDPDCKPDILLGSLNDRVNKLAIDNTRNSLSEIALLERVISENILEDSEGAADYTPALIDYIASSDISFIESVAIELDDTDLLKDPEFDAVYRALNCADDGDRPTVESLSLTLQELNNASDLFGESALGISSMCAGWPESVSPLAPMVTNTAPVSLVIGGTSDYALPSEISKEMAAQIGGVYIESAHDGHTGVFLDKSKCLDNLVANFLIDGTLPEEQTCS